MNESTINMTPPSLATLPGDEVRQIMWRFSDRYDMQMLLQAVRDVARGPVARLVAAGGRNTHEWTSGKEDLIRCFDEAGITTGYVEPEYGGLIGGPKNLLLSLVAYELAWVDAGAATSSLAGSLAFAPIQERGTPEQIAEYMSRTASDGKGGHLRGAFGLTEPLPYVGVDTGTLCGKVRVAEWEEGKEPLLQVDKRGRFITNMDMAQYVTVAVDTDDERIASSCMIIVEETDPGLFDRGAPTMKLVHQLSSTRDPVLNLTVPANRIIGGYTVKDGKIVPNFNHGEVIQAVFKHTRVSVGLMTAAKLLSAIEPVIRYQRGRYRGRPNVDAGTARFDLGLQQKEDVLHRLIDIWATGEAAASLGFAAARLFDVLDPLEREKDKILAEQGMLGGRAQMKALRKVEKDALEYLDLKVQPEATRDNARLAELEADTLVQFMVLDAVGNVLCPACKLWNTGHGTNVMREALSLMGGYAITEDCPGFLCQKWMDAQLEATYEGPEAVQRRQLSVTMTLDLFLAQFRQWITEMRHIAADRPGTGACTLGTAMELWLFSLNHLQKANDGDGKSLYKGVRQGVTFPLADALCWILAARQLILDVIELETKGAENASLAEGLPGFVAFYRDLCHVQSARAAGEVGRICAELVHGYTYHPKWDGENCGCYSSEELDALECAAPGMASVCESTGCNGERPRKAGPCVQFDGLETFQRMRMKLDGCLTGSRLAKDRAAQALTGVMIPEALDYPR
jgi:alkylation response protein AidB-like acyl-CoA dehydrogenase